MTRRTKHGRPRASVVGVILAASAAALAAGFLVPAWWALLPIAVLWGGIVGAWRRWYLSLPVGFVIGAVSWLGILATLPSAARASLAAQLGAAEGLGPVTFLLLGPLLFGLVAAAGAAALAGAIGVLSARFPPAPPAGTGHPDAAADPPV